MEMLVKLTIDENLSPYMAWHGMQWYANDNANTNANASVACSHNRSVIIIIFMPVQPSDITAISCGMAHTKMHPIDGERKVERPERPCTVHTCRENFF